jgi:hypothetical protein
MNKPYDLEEGLIDFVVDVIAVVGPNWGTGLLRSQSIGHDLNLGGGMEDGGKAIGGAFLLAYGDATEGEDLRR